MRVLSVLFCLLGLISCHDAITTSPDVYVDEDFTSEEMVQIQTGAEMWEPALHFRFVGTVSHEWLLGAIHDWDLGNTVYVVRSPTRSCPYHNLDGYMGATYRHADSAEMCLDGDTTPIGFLDAIAGHEFGHTMRLDHVNDYALMNANVTARTPQCVDFFILSLKMGTRVPDKVTCNFQLPPESN